MIGLLTRKTTENLHMYIEQVYLRGYLANIDDGY